MLRRDELRLICRGIQVVQDAIWERHSTIGTNSHRTINDEEFNILTECVTNLERVLRLNGYVNSNGQPKKLK